MEKRRTSNSPNFNISFPSSGLNQEINFTGAGRAVIKDAIPLMARRMEPLAPVRGAVKPNVPM